MVIPPIPVFHGFSAPRASIAAGLRPAAPGGAATLTAPGASAQGPRGPGLGQAHPVAGWKIT